MTNDELYQRVMTIVDKSSRKPLTLRVDEDIIKEIKIYCINSNISVSDLVSLLFKDFLDFIKERED